MFIHLIHLQHDQVILMPGYMDSTILNLKSDGTAKNRKIGFDPVY